MQQVFLLPKSIRQVALPSRLAPRVRTAQGARRRFRLCFILLGLLGSRMTNGAGWDNLYAAEQGYTFGFYSQQSPEHLSYSCVLNGVEPIPVDRPFTYFELGFGQGLTVTLLAASNPHARFYANDFMPAHVAAATALASSATLDNLTFLEESFAELAEGKVALPQFDFITMHGVYAWVSAENRAHIVNFIARYLKPGGIVYTGYNAMPGWTPMLPLQKLMLAHARSYPDGDDQIEQVRKLVLSLAAAQPMYFADNPDLQRRLTKLRDADPAYLAHEYLVEGWQPRYHAEVATEFSTAKLSYVGSAMLCSAFDQIPPDQQRVIETLHDPMWRETAKDFFANTGFRQDVFVRGSRSMSSRRKAEWLNRYAIALTVPRDLALTVFTKLTGREKDAAHALVDVLAQDPCTLYELAQIPLLQGRGDDVGILTALLTHANYASVFLGGAIGKDVGPALRLNHSLVQRSRYEDCYKALAAPLIGNGIKVDLMDRLVYLQLADRPHDTDAQAIANYVIRYMREQSVVVPQPNAQTSLVMSVGEIVARVETILGTHVPLWRQLKMI
jgi:SAM-dependent methyltransferase